MKDHSEYDDYEFDRMVDEGHSKDCDKWLSLSLPCSCSVRRRDMPDPHEDRAMDAFMDIYNGWEDDNPVRTPKDAKPKMGRDGDSVKLLSKIIGKKK
jgi:hypothetical protein